jgi:hypothetical protein
MCSVGKRKKKDPVTLLGKYLPTPFSLFLIEASSRVCVCVQIELVAALKKTATKNTRR